MRLVLVLAFTASFPIDAASACHHFRYWRYLTPQRCAAGHGNGRDTLVRLARPPDRPQGARTAGAQVDAPPMPEDKSWYVEIVPSDDDLHAIGVKKLKEELQQ